MEIVLANPRGFCAGVDRAIAIVNRALECFNPPIYVRHEVVHNKFVVDDLRQRGAVFVDELDQVPDDSIVIFSAHGVSKAVQQEADRRGLKVFDATCPLVTKVHIETNCSQSKNDCVHANSCAQSLLGNKEEVHLTNPLLLAENSLRSNDENENKDDQCSDVFKFSGNKES